MECEGRTSRLDRERVERLGSPLARRVELYAEVPSTQERAKELAREGAPHGTLVVAGVQTGGRGRLGRAWSSPAGGLWMSLVLRPEIPAIHAPRITLAAAVGVAKALREMGVEAEIKWPNDLLVGGRKVCGILAEAGFGRSGGLEFAVLGVGINANVDPASVEGLGGTSLRAELGREVDLVRLLAAVLGGLEVELARLNDFEAIASDWRSLSCTLGRRVRVRRAGGVVEGLAVDLGPDGELLLETGDGRVALFEGEVERLR